MRRTPVQKRPSRECRPPRPGDLFRFPNATAPTVTWAVLMTHPDNAHLYFVIPGDDNPLAGTADIVVPVPASAARKAMTLRCGFGLWIAEGYFDHRLNAGSLDEQAIRLARNKLSQLVACRTEGTPEQYATEDDPSYTAWLQRIEAARAAVERRLARQGLVVVQGEFQCEPPEALRELLASTTYRTLTQKASAGATDLSGPPARPAWLRIPCQRSGELFLETQPRGVRVLWVGHEGRPPALLGRGRDGRTMPARWRRANGGFLAEPVLPWRAGQVVLHIGPGKGFKVRVCKEIAEP